MDPTTFMDLNTLITTAAVAGTATIGTTALQETTKHLFKTFMERLRGKAGADTAASTALATADDPEAVYKAVKATKAADDPQLVDLARQLTQSLPPLQVAQTQTLIAKNIQINYGSNVTNTFN